MSRLVRWIKNRARRVFQGLRWMIQPVLPRATGRRRLLIVYDFETQPMSVGDILLFQATALALREDHGVDQIDLAFLYNPEGGKHPESAFHHIDRENIHSNLSWILQAAQVNPYLGSVLLFADRRQLEQYVSQSLDEAMVWPPLGHYASAEYLYYEIFNSVLSEFFKRHGSIPPLRSRHSALTWGRKFLHENTNGAIVVSVQLRRNPHNPVRDSDYEAWLDLFNGCRKSDPDVSFVVLCGADEVDERLFELPNVVVAKRFCTNVEQDLALVELADIHLGASSGPGTMAILSDKPYCLFGWNADPKLHHGMRTNGSTLHFFFAGEHQRLRVEKETAQILAAEYRSLRAYLDARAT